MSFLLHRELRNDDKNKWLLEELLQTFGSLDINVLHNNYWLYLDVVRRCGAEEASLPHI